MLRPSCPVCTRIPDLVQLCAVSYLAKPQTKHPDLVEWAMAEVKTSLSRAERAKKTRQRMLDSAQDLFLSNGYGGTTMAEIAAAAEVAVQTVYYTFKTKGKLLIELVEVVAAGGDPNPVPVPERPWFREMMSSQSPQRVLALDIEHGAAIYERVSHLWPAVTSALSDPDVARFWEGVSTGRRRAMRGLIEKIEAMGALRTDLNTERATDLLDLLAGHDPYNALVKNAGWPVTDYCSWLFSTLIQQLLGTTAVEPEAVAGLSFSSHL